MKGRDFKIGVERVLLSTGFEAHGRSLRRYDSRIWTLVGTEKGFGQQWHISVGFWLEVLGLECPEQVERTHLYFRLERLFHEYHEAITLAGSLGDQRQPKAFENLMELLLGEIDRGLRALGTEDGLRDALTAGRLTQGLISREARERLGGAQRSGA